MKNELAKTNNSEISVSIDTLKSYLNAQGLANKLNDQETTQFLQIASAFGLNPFKREIYAIKYGNTFSIITGYETYLKRAERTGLLNGWQTELVQAGQDTKAVVTIYKKGWEKPFIHEAYLSEAKQESPIWKKMPKFMLKKVAIAQAFRLCFPDDMGGLPYTSDEITVEGVANEMANDSQLEEIGNIIQGLEDAKKVKPTKWIESKGGLDSLTFQDAQTFLDTYKSNKNED